MTDKEYEEVKKRIIKILDEWAFGRDRRMPALADWLITPKFLRTPFETADGEEAGAHVSSEWFYKTAEIEFNCVNLYNAGDKLLERIVIHELCHLLVNEMRELGDYANLSASARRHEERVVTDLSTAFLVTKYRDLDDEAGTGGKVGAGVDSMQESSRETE